MGIPASQRLRKQSDFLQVRRSEHRIHCGPFVFQCELGGAGSTELPSLGVIASRRVGNAVVRNRGKRLTRELFRHHAGMLPPGSRVVVVLRAGYRRSSFADLNSQFIDCCNRILKKSESGGHS